MVGLLHHLRLFVEKNITGEYDCKNDSALIISLTNLALFCFYNKKRAI